MPPVKPPKKADPAAQQTSGSADTNARSTMHAAWVAAGAAILAALLSVWLQTSGETNKSRAEFLRGQQQVLYAKVIDHEVMWSDAESNYFILATRRPTLPDPTVHDAADAEYDAKKTFQADGNVVKIIGSKKVVDEYNKLLDAHDTYGRAVVSYLAEFGKAEECTTQACKDKYDTIVDTQDSVEDSKSALLEAFRADLGAK
jgi:hypothetical protein